MNSQTAHFSLPSSSSNSSSLPSGAHGFDFFFGLWQVRNRRLKERMAGCSEWEEFDATSDCHPILGGAGNQDEFLSRHWPDFIGMSLRLFDPQTQTWSIFWIDNQSVVMQPPVVGRFIGNEGIFEGPDEFNGKPIVVRYLWSRIETATPRWEQAFSSDHGTTWETNWIMNFQRLNHVIGG
ncbi:MAG TPA: hypothetical protein VNW52_05900 [Burkholderiaceae bacterium]|jgi:hypothetical protein|nr:hypothetical protein [Burkholderiaceae bacterium]